MLIFLAGGNILLTPAQRRQITSGLQKQAL